MNRSDTTSDHLALALVHKRKIKLNSVLLLRGYYDYLPRVILVPFALNI